MSTSTLGQGPSPRKNPSSAMGRIPPRPVMTEDKGNGLSLRVALQVTPWNRKSTKTEKGQRRKWKCLREKRSLLHSVPCTWHSHASLPLQPLRCHYCIQCLVPDIAMLFWLYNHSQQLRGRADGTNISTRNPIHEEGNYYKRGWREAEKGGWNPYHSRGPRKSSSDRAEDQPF